MYVRHTTIPDREGTDRRSGQIEELVRTLGQRREYRLMRRAACHHHAVHHRVLPLTSRVDDLDLLFSVASGRVDDQRAEASTDVEHHAGQLARRRLLARRHVVDAFSETSGGSML